MYFSNDVKGAALAPHLNPSEGGPILKSHGESIAGRPELILNFTIVALVGMLAGFILGILYTRGDAGARDTPAHPPVPHPRSLEPTPSPTR